MPNDTTSLAPLDRGKVETDYQAAFSTLATVMGATEGMLTGDLDCAPRLVTASDREIAGVLLVSLVKPGIKFARSKVSPVVKATAAAHTAAKALEHELVDPWLALEKVLKRAMADYDTAARAAAQRERDRIAAEVTASLQASAAREAAALAERGDIDGAVAIMEQPTPALDLPPVTHRPVKVAGVSSRPVYRYRIVAPDKIGRDFLMPDEKSICQCVEQWGKSAEEMVGGIEVYEDTIIGGRTT